VVEPDPIVTFFCVGRF